MRPDVSICIPTFDRLDYLKEAVASARAQTFPDIEILIGDDGDSAPLRAFCLEQAADDPRVRYEKTPHRLGLAGNWNFLARMARGRFVNIIGDDDRLLPGFVERLLAASGRDTSVVFCNHFIIDSAGNRLTADTHATAVRYGRANLDSGPIADAQLFFWRNTLPMSASIIDAEQVRRFGFKEDINTPEPELFARMMRNNPQVVFAADYLMEYRVHPRSATAHGLTVDRLAEYLDAIPVPAHVEEAKRRFIAPLMVAGVGVRLRRGDIQGARALVQLRSYPAPSQLGAALQRASLWLPEGIAARVYQALYRARRFLRLAARSHN